MKDADVIITATSATAPLVTSQMINPFRETLIIAMGSDTPSKNELAPDLFADASRFVCDLRSQCRDFGELRSVLASGYFDIGKTEELGAACRDGKRRMRHDKLIICDLTGVGITDLAIAMYAQERFSKSNHLIAHVDSEL